MEVYPLRDLWKVKAEIGRRERRISNCAIPQRENRRHGGCEGGGGRGEGGINVRTNG